MPLHRTSTMDADEELARQLQAEFDVETQPQEPKVQISQADRDDLLTTSKAMYEQLKILEKPSSDFARRFYDGLWEKYRQNLNLLEQLGISRTWGSIEGESSERAGTSASSKRLRRQPRQREADRPRISRNRG